ncbi:MAG: hypothetical protein ABSF45_24815 [Terriglobia bacterium]|jgi:hypothetical protein
MGSVETFAGGLLGLVAAAGVGCGFTRMLGPIPSRWRLAAWLVSGVAIIDWAVMMVLFWGGGVTGVRIVGAGALVLGSSILLVSRDRISLAPALKTLRNSDRWFVAVIVVACAINLFIAIAPSTKIDELHYHMLIPKRIMEDDGLHLYRLPYEAAIFPQTAFQLGLTAEHAAGFPEAGNMVSWGLGIALILLVTGVTADLTASASAGWITGAIASVGLYPAVWHVTSGPHALGDISTVTACLLALLPDTQTVELKSKTRLILICLAAYAAVSTKISNLPVAATITLIGVHRASAELGWRKAAGIALAVWSVFYGPIILWTTWQCGSPWGLATATLFHSRYFGPEAIDLISGAKDSSPRGWMQLFQWLAPSVSVGVVAAFGIVAFGAFKRERMSLIVCGLVGGQALLIVWLLPQMFRFLGGLQYIVIIVGAWIFWPSRFGARLMARWWLVLLGLCLPWVAVQAYYARPFIKVDGGLVSRDSFREEYVAFSKDFRELDRLLPRNAVLYAVNTRLPSYYAPRPVIFTLEDLRGRGPLYRFTVGEDASPPMRSLSCSETIYQNPEALSVVYREPGRAAVHEPLKVERCDIVGPVRPTPLGCFLPRIAVILTEVGGDFDPETLFVEDCRRRCTEGESAFNVERQGDPAYNLGLIKR